MRIKKRITRCAYCRHEVHGTGMPHNGILYCSKPCRELGIDRLAKADAIVNPITVRSPWYIVLAAIATLLTMAVSDRVLAQEDIYEKWRQPGKPNSSCCNGHKMVDGVWTGDCATTRAKFERGSWWAFVAKQRMWVQIPDEKIVTYKTDDIEAHLCFSEQYGHVYCFRPPKLGM
ncbi:MAG: hypothetical protein KF889_01670 [Alphaproteobacteria bacterium]|nr:hypothetical protein [Alphaproteobacteria bacterium]MCW5741616.1 hypothetical protein [Alphaproteobacteria bacterium]